MSHWQDKWEEGRRLLDEVAIYTSSPRYAKSRIYDVSQCKLTFQDRGRELYYGASRSHLCLLVQLHWFDHFKIKGLLKSFDWIRSITRGPSLSEHLRSLPHRGCIVILVVSLSSRFTTVLASQTMYINLSIHELHF